MIPDGIRVVHAGGTVLVLFLPFIFNKPSKMEIPDCDDWIQELCSSILNRANHKECCKRKGRKISTGVKTSEWN